MAQIHINCQHSIEHERARVRVCRRCGVVINSKKTSNLSHGGTVSCLSTRCCEKLISYWSIDVHQDSSFFPTVICGTCYITLNKIHSSCGSHDDSKTRAGIQYQFILPVREPIHLSSYCSQENQCQLCKIVYCRSKLSVLHQHDKIKQDVDEIGSPLRPICKSVEKCIQT